MTSKNSRISCNPKLGDDSAKKVHSVRGEVDYVGFITYSTWPLGRLIQTSLNQEVYLTNIDGVVQTLGVDKAMHTNVVPSPLNKALDKLGLYDKPTERQKQNLMSRTLQLKATIPHRS